MRVRVIQSLRGKIMQKVESEDVARRTRPMVLGERREDQHLVKPLLLCLLLGRGPLCERRGTKALTQEVTCEASGRRHPRGDVGTWQAALQEASRHSRLQDDGPALHMGQDAGRGWKGDLGVHLEEKQWPLGTQYMVAMETSRIQAT